MLYAVFVTLIAWGAILFALGRYLTPMNAPRWARKTINLFGASVAVLWVAGMVLYGGLDQLLAENSILWSLS